MIAKCNNRQVYIRFFIKAALIAFANLIMTANSYSACNKIVSLAPSITETLFYLDLGKNIVGITRYAKWPKETKHIFKIGGYYDPNIEAVVKIHPDMVFLTYHQRQIIPELNQLKIDYKLLKFDTLADMYDSVEMIGKICNKTDESDMVLERARKKLGLAKKICLKNRKKTALVLIGDLFPPTAAGNKTFFSDMLNLFSIENAYKGTVSWPQIPLENIAKLDPDYLFIISDKKRLDSTAFSSLKIKAVKKRHIIYLIGQRYLVNSPRIAEVFLQTAKKICK